jgi:septum formation protein
VESSREPRIVLASESPRRSDLLTRIVGRFDVLPARVDEDAASLGAATPEDGALASARAKALAVAAQCPDAVVIGCDTVVIVDGQALGKPKDEDDAIGMLLSLGGREHEVATGVVVCLPGGRILEALELTRVTFRPLTRQLAAGYVAQGESLDKAGAYGIQGLGSLLVERIEGCYYNVVGLPLHRLGRMLEDAGLKLFPF